MRESDFKGLITSLKDELTAETGPYSKRDAWLKYAKWVALNGGKVRGVKPHQQKAFFQNLGALADSRVYRVPRTLATAAMQDTEYEHMLQTVWPLQVRVVNCLGARSLCSDLHSDLLDFVRTVRALRTVKLLPRYGATVR
jgi:hypothetical protein